MEEKGGLQPAWGAVLFRVSPEKVDTAGTPGAGRLGCTEEEGRTRDVQSYCENEKSEALRKVATSPLKR